MRLDKYLIENGYFESRNRALEAIKSGNILVNGKSVKASTKIEKNSKIEIKKEKFYIGRAGKKLDFLLKEYNLDIENRNALDIGSSTGGFAQILMEQKVKSLICVDVGKNQLHYSLKNLKNLTYFEELDIRDYKPNKKFDLISCDVSFISILKIINDIDRLSSKDILILYKPQFEVGKNIKRDSKGVVKDLFAIKESQKEFLAKTRELLWELVSIIPSPLLGKEGNQEYFYHFKKGDLSL